MRTARLIVALLLLATAASAQTTVTRTDRLVLANPPAKSSETACLWRDASTGMVAAGACPTGTVTSVGLSLPAIFSVSGSPVTGAGTLTASLVSQTQNLVWAAPNGSSGTPTFRALVDADIPDNLTLGTVSGNPAFSGYIASSLLPNTTDTYDLGSGARLWNQAFISQLNAVVFAEATTTLFGGYSIIGYNAGALAADVSSAATTVNFGKAMTVGHWVVIRAHDTGGTVQAEYLLVGSLVSGTTYNVTRDLAGAHGTDPAWASGTPFLVLGADGTGRVELSAYSTPTGTSPGARVSIITQGATYGALTERVRLGILDGMPGMAAGKYGIYIGDTTGAQGLSYYDGALTVKGTVTATAGTIGGWTLGATALTSGSGSTTVGLDSGGSNPALYAGSATPGSAPFRVTNAGALTATNATITGTVNFGGGSGVLDSNGLRVTSYTSSDVWDTLNAVSFTGPTNSTGRMGMAGYEATTHAVKHLRLEAINSRADSTNNSGMVRLTAGGTDDGNTYRESSIVVEAAGASDSDIVIDAASSLYLDGPVLPLGDDADVLGSSDLRWKNIHLALGSGGVTFPYVVVGDPTTPSMLAYYSRAEETITIAGCSLTFRHGLLIGTSGC